LLAEQAEGDGAQEFLKTCLLRDSTTWGGSAAIGKATALTA
jgi:hypothetical protein